MKRIFTLVAAVVAVAILTGKGTAGDVEQITSASLDIDPPAVRMERVQVCETDAFGRKTCRWVTVAVPDKPAESKSRAAEVLPSPASTSESTGTACPCVAASGSCQCAGSTAAVASTEKATRLGSFLANRPRVLARAVGAIFGGGCCP